MTEKHVRRERHLANQPSLGVRLDKGDLAELWLRRHHADSLRERYSHGAMSFPRSKVLKDEQLSDCISLLEAQGRARVDVRLEKHGGDGSSGNVVIYPQPDASVEEAIQEASTTALDPLLRMYSTNVVPMESVTILPNTSSSAQGKAKGMVIQAPVNADRWWRDLQGLGWSFGRGMRIVSLGMNTDQFIDQSDHLLAQALGMSRSFPVGSLKYVWFLHDHGGQMFMAVAGGPSVDNTKEDLQILAKTPKISRAQAYIKERGEYYRDMRDWQTAALAAALGITVDELATDVTYINADLDRHLLISGATDTVANGLAPFTMGTAGIILHPESSNDIVPIGTKLIRQVSGFEPILPPGIITPHRLGQAPTALFAQDDIKEHVASFDRPMELQSLALGFHADWR